MTDLTSIPAPMLPVFYSHPEEVHLIGNVLMAYGEVEWGFVNCLSTILDTETAFKLAYRTRGETARLETVDVHLRPKVREFDLLPTYEEAWKAANHCRKIRNEYAHSHWLSDEHGLQMINVERSARSREPGLNWTYRIIDTWLLEKHCSYFMYTIYLLFHLAEEIEARLGLEANRIWNLPDKEEQPPLGSAYDVFARKGLPRPQP